MIIAAGEELVVRSLNADFPRPGVSRSSLSSSLNFRRGTDGLVVTCYWRGREVTEDEVSTCFFFLF